MENIKNIIKSLLGKTLNIIYSIFFSRPKNKVLHIWKPVNYLKQTLFRWYLLEKPLQEKGIFLPLNFKKVKNIKEFRTFHNEHLVLDKFMCIFNQEIYSKRFIDIGAGDGVDMSNVFNLVNKNFHGVMVEVDKSKFAKLSTIYRDIPNVELYNTKITPLNVSHFFKFLDLDNQFDVLNLDIDSYDFYVLEEILKLTKFNFLILEINPMFTLDIDFAVTYTSDFSWQGNNFQGASLSMYYKLLNKYEYEIIYIDRSFVLAISKKLNSSKIPPIKIGEMDSILTESLKNGDKYRYDKYYSKYRELSTIQKIELVEKEFIAFENYYLGESGLT